MQVQVRTTQNVFIQYQIAGVGDRIVAYLIDGIIKVIFVLAIIAIYIGINQFESWVWIIAAAIPVFLYHLLFEIFMNGQSPGKLIMRIKVIRLDGTPATVGDFLLRWIFAFIDLHLIGGAVAVLCIAIGNKGQRLGDMVAGTTVVKVASDAQTNADEIFVPQNSDYVLTFPRVIQLTEKDIELIQKALEVNRFTGNPKPVIATSEKIKTLLGIETDLPPVKFLYTIIKDFQQITSKG
ncbi:MAG: RDD family protein [Cyclobacteriaceae bacterium]|nr:RDD family protein [Cyclobacteriaceae bacterium]